MRKLLFATLVVSLLSGTAFAQGKNPPKPPAEKQDPDHKKKGDHPASRPTSRGERGDKGEKGRKPRNGGAGGAGAGKTGGGEE